jgi:phosphotransferase system enzyme I (PtsI)
MQVLRGKPVCAGIAEGRIFYFKRGVEQVIRRSVSDTAAEHARVSAAREKACGELKALHDKALPQVGEQGAMIFEIHQMMLEDEDYRESIESIIDTQGVNAEYAVGVTADTFAMMFSEMEDPYMRARAADVRDVSARLINCLTGGAALTGPTEPVIVAADDLTPSETIQLDKANILAFATSGGSTNSHTAILARTMGIPAVIGLGEGLTRELHGAEAVVNGSAGELYIRPDGETLAALREKKKRDDEYKALLEEYKDKPNVTLDGTEVLIYSNIGNPTELGLVLQNDSGGIGLFRSEFIFLESDTAPTEEQQFQIYKTVAQAMAGKRVIFRTLDAGADKRIAYLDMAEEENPALGIRGLRLCLERPGLFKTQLRAMLRASAFGKVAIMFPMVSSAWEVEAAKKALEEAKRELGANGAEYDGAVEVGIMIETPAAAMISGELAPLVDFFSVGTNDLTQYTLAVDRQNDALDRYCDTHHEAVLRLIELSAKNAHAHGKWIGICGELAADLRLTERFLRMGIDELSVSPVKTLELRRAVRELRL